MKPLIALLLLAVCWSANGMPWMNEARDQGYYVHPAELEDIAHTEALRRETIRLGEFGVNSIVTLEYTVPIGGIINFNLSPDEVDSTSSTKVIEVEIRYNRQDLTRSTIKVEQYLNQHFIRCANWDTNFKTWGETFFPITPGTTSKLDIITDDNGFSIAINDVYVDKCQFEVTPEYEALVKSIRFLNVKTVRGSRLRRAQLMVGKVIRTSYKSGRVAYIQAVAPPNDADFRIELLPERPAKAISISLCMDVETDEDGGKVVTFYSVGEFGMPSHMKTINLSELDLPFEPFKAGGTFNVAITCQHYGFEISLEGFPITHYGHVIPYREYAAVLLYGVEEMKGIEFI